MTKTFSVDDSNDLFIGRDGNLAIAVAIEAVLQNCAHAVKTRLGEMIFNTDQGIPFFETVWNGIPNIPQFEAAARQAILQVSGVVEIRLFNVVIIEGNLTYTAVIKTIYGEGTIDGGL
jgi:hypothetical protein